MSKFDLVDTAIKNGKTVLGVGPMSKNTIKAVIDVANEDEIPMLLIPSRRQVESIKFGGGYVDSTEHFVEYVRKNDKGGYILIERDHGGPGQGKNPIDSWDKVDAMLSYRADIESGFDILHLDISKLENPTHEDLLDYYNSCEAECKEAGKEVLYEVGIELHGGTRTDIQEFTKLCEFIYENLPKTKFVVANVGFFVLDKKYGHCDSFLLGKLNFIAQSHGMYVKLHNMDYTYNTLQLECGIRSGHVSAINIAPELGTFETKLKLRRLRESGKFPQAEDIVRYSVNSGKWWKWVPDQFNVPNQEERTRLCGHYMYTDSYFSPDELFDIQSSLKDLIRAKLRLCGWYP